MKRQVTGFAGIVIYILLWLISCSDNPQRYASGHLVINFQVNSDPLFENVSSVCLHITDPSGQSVYDTVFSYDPLSGVLPELVLDLEIESSSIFRAWFYDPDRRPLYKSLESFNADSDPLIILPIRQFGYRSASNVKVLRDAPP